TQETGADIAVSDDGVVGTVTIGSKESTAVEEAKRRIMLILEPPIAELGAEYTGKVVNITKFGAFVNILPGRDGLLHISKIGRGKRVERVEDVLSLGDEVRVRVDDIDNAGKLSLSFADDGESAADGDASDGAAGAARDDGAGGSRERSSGRDRDGGSDRETASFEDVWEAQAREEFGNLGPGEEARSAPPRQRRGDGRRGGRR